MLYAPIIAKGPATVYDNDQSTGRRGIWQGMGFASANRCPGVLDGPGAMGYNDGQEGACLDR